MKIECACGHLIHDNSDRLAHKAHFVPDQSWNDLCDGLDALIEKGGRRSDEAAMAARRMLTWLSRRMWQCGECGRLFVEDGDRELHVFAAEEPARAKAILAAGND